MQLSVKSVLKVTISILVFAGLYLQILARGELSELWTAFAAGRTSYNYIFLAGALLLLPLNWGVEALKWQYLLKGIECISFAKAMKAVLAGVSLAIITPSRIGEYGGRIWYLRQGLRLKGIVVTIVGSIGQITVTLIMGGAGLFFYFFISGFPRYIPSWLAMAVLFLYIVLSLFLFFRLGWLGVVLQRWPLIHSRQKWIRAVRVFTYYGHKKLLGLLLLSAARFAVYALQFALLLNFFHVSVPLFEGALLSSAVFLGQMMLPVPAIAEFGTRSGLSVFIFGTFSASPLPLISASLALWLINLALPAFFGAILLLFKKQEFS